MISFPMPLYLLICSGVLSLALYAIVLNLTNHVTTQYPLANCAAIYPTHMRAKNFPPTEALSPETSLKLLIDVLMLTAIVVDVIAATCSSCVLKVVIPAPALWIFVPTEGPIDGATNATADRIIDKPFPMRPMMKTARTTPDAVSMRDFADFPRAGTLLMAGIVMLAAAMSVESEILLVRFAKSKELKVRFMIRLDFRVEYLVGKNLQAPTLL